MYSFSHLACARVDAVGSASVFFSAEVCLIQVQQRLLNARHMMSRSCGAKFGNIFIRPPGTLVPKAFCFSRDVFYLFIYLLTRHRISELRRPIAAKLCTVISTCVNFLMQVQKLGSPPLKKLAGQKHAKFGPILHNFRLWSRISPERDKISKIGKTHDL